MSSTVYNLVRSRLYNKLKNEQLNIKGDGICFQCQSVLVSDANVTDNPEKLVQTIVEHERSREWRKSMLSGAE